jgi:uncharacterized protein
MQEWDEAADFLATPAAYGQSGPVQVIDTSVSRVFLAGDYAYKIKKPVRLSYLDFSTRELRRADCEREAVLNRRTAPSLYLGVSAVTRENDASLMIDGAGEAIEWAVRMRRFEESALLSAIAAKGLLTREMIGRLARNLVAFHSAIPPEFEAGGAEKIRQLLTGNEAEYRCFAGNAFEYAAIAALHAASLAALNRHAPLLDARKAAGWVRHCHGDLHLGNIFCHEGEPEPFDCITFNDEIARIDILYDLAFLLMDLWRYGLRQEANHCLNQYLAHQSPEDALASMEGLALLPLFLSCRAGVRAFVAARAASSCSEPAPLLAEARNFFSLAQQFLNPSAPHLLAIGGFSGTGKSALARSLAPRLGAAPGALVLRSDEIRKQLAGAPLLEPLPPSAYTIQNSAQVYACMVARARTALSAGHSVIADAVYARAAERAALAEAAKETGVAFQGLWLEAPLAVLEQRIGARRGDASDADAQVARRQFSYDTGAIGWTRIDASGTAEETLARVMRKHAEGLGLTA